MAYRRSGWELEVLLVHPGGPLWVKKDDGVWSVPKGEYFPDEDPLAVALREFEEETGQTPPTGEPFDLGEITQKGGKVVCVWAVEGDADVETVTSNTFEMMWPPKSGQMKEFPEVDRAGWFTVSEATRKLKETQIPLIERLVERLASR